MKVYIVRHGETMVNASNKLQGRINCGLTEDGLKQCIELRKKFEDKKIDLIISSPLDRCKQTAEALSNGKIPIEYTKPLNTTMKITAYINASSPKIAEITGNPMNPTFPNIVINIYVPRCFLGTRVTAKKAIPITA